MVDQYLKEKDFFLAIQKNDFAQISFLKDEGDIPSPEAINNLKGRITAATPRFRASHQPQPNATGTSRPRLLLVFTN